MRYKIGGWSENIKGYIESLTPQINVDLASATINSDTIWESGVILINSDIIIPTGKELILDASSILSG